MSDDSEPAYTPPPAWVADVQALAALVALEHIVDDEFEVAA